MKGVDSIFLQTNRAEVNSPTLFFASEVIRAYVKLFEPFLRNIAVSRLEVLAGLELKEVVVYNIEACSVSPNARIGNN